MTIENFCKIDVITISKECKIKEAAELMKKHHVGNLVVVEDTQSKKNPCGMITDRDIVLNIVAQGKSYDTPVQEIMSKNVLVIKHHQGFQETIQQLAEKSVRRAPIVDDNNKVIGIAAVDDLLPVLADELSCVADLIDKQTQKASRKSYDFA